MSWCNSCSCGPLTTAALTTQQLGQLTRNHPKNLTEVCICSSYSIYKWDLIIKEVLSPPRYFILQVPSSDGVQCFYAGNIFTLCLDFFFSDFFFPGCFFFFFQNKMALESMLFQNLLALGQLRNFNLQPSFLNRELLYIIFCATIT